MLNHWKSSAVAQRLGLTAPIVQGPFGSGLSAVDLVVAVAESGLLGSFGVHHLDGAGIVDIASRIRARTAGPFALNLWIPLHDSEAPQLSDAQYLVARELLQPYFNELDITPPPRPASFGPNYEEQVEAVLECRPAVFSFVYGVLSADILERCRALGITTLGAATTVAEAKLLEYAGVDFIVATGFEAGGHRVSFLQEPESCLTGTLSLIPQIVDAVKIPVIAAGGIADGRGIAAAMMLGAQGVQIGTAFLACEESSASQLHRDKLFSPDATQTVLTRAFTGRLARGIRNHMINAMQPHAASFAQYPVQAWLMAQLKQAAIAANRSDLLPLWSGQSAPLLKHRRARDLCADLIAQASMLLDAELG
jgi:nitronate monooxygenase